MSGHFLVINMKGEDWEIEHPEECPTIKVYDADPFHPEAGPVMEYDCLVGRIAAAEGIDDHLTGWNGEPTWKDLEPGKYEITAWEHRGTSFHSMYEEYEAGLEFVDVDDRGSAP